MDKDRTKPNFNWYLVDSNNNCWAPEQYGYMQLAVMMDIRRELKTLNALLGCHNAIAIPTILREIAQQSNLIRRNTTKPRRRTRKRA